MTVMTYLVALVEGLFTWLGHGIVIVCVVVAPILSAMTGGYFAARMVIRAELWDDLVRWRKYLALCLGLSGALVGAVVGWSVIETAGEVISGNILESRDDTGRLPVEGTSISSTGSR